MAELALDMGDLRSALADIGADGWLLYDFHGVNPVTPRVLGLSGMATRRLFVLLPREGDPIAVAHKIELQPLQGFPGTILPYARWQELEEALGGVVRGKTLAMEVFPDDGVPYLDRVPAGVVELLTRLGATVVPSSSLVTRFAARWLPSEVEDHLFAAETIADIARTILADVVANPESGVGEVEVQRRVVASMESRGLVLDTLPIVAFGANAANPHYEPVEGKDSRLKPDEVVLLDLWGGRGSRYRLCRPDVDGIRRAEPIRQGYGGLGDRARRPGCGGRVDSEWCGGGTAGGRLRGRPCRAGSH